MGNNDNNDDSNNNNTNNNSNQTPYTLEESAISLVFFVRKRSSKDRLRGLTNQT